MKEQKTDDPPFSSSEKLYPPFQFIKKVMNHLIFYRPPPIEKMIGPLAR